MYFRHFHRHLQGTLLTFDINICRHLNWHVCTPLEHARTSSNKKTAHMDVRAHGKRRDRVFSPEAAARHWQFARFNTDFLWQLYFFKNFGLSPYRREEEERKRGRKKKGKTTCLPSPQTSTGSIWIVRELGDAGNVCGVSQTLVRMLLKFTTFVVCEKKSDWAGSMRKVQKKRGKRGCMWFFENKIRIDPAQS